MGWIIGGVVWNNFLFLCHAARKGRISEDHEQHNLASGLLSILLMVLMVAKNKYLYFS